MSTRLNQRVVPKAASYTIEPSVDAPGTVFTTRGATGAVTFTLPTPGRQLLGHWYEFYNVVGQNMVVAGALATKHNAAAASVTCSTAGELIGAHIRAVCGETAAGTYKWLTSGIAVGHTYTVA